MDDLIFATILASVGAVLLWLFWVLLYRPYAERKERARPRFVPDGRGETRRYSVFSGQQ